MKFKGVFFILIVMFIIFLFLFIIKFSGFAVQNTLSEVTIDKGIIVLYDKFDGSTTDFVSIDDTELETIENMILENILYGKIVFNEIVNLTQDVENNSVDLDSYVNISFNEIEINTTKLTSLEKPATLYLYNLTFSDPRVLRDGSVCPSSICTENSYSGGTFSFNVTNFTIYSSEETPSVLEVTPSIGGGATLKSNFTLNKDLIKILLKQGETKREVIEIKNTGQTILSISIKLEFIEKFVAVSEDSFSLNPGKTRIINMDFFAKENEIPDAYIGRIIIEGGGITEIINVIIEVKEKKPLFDISVGVRSKEVNPGEQVEADISVINMGDLENIDVLIYYAIKDFRQNILSFKEESLFIKDELNIKRKLRVPENAPFGAYVFYSKVSYGNISASGADVFTVTEKIRLFNFILVILIIFLAILIYLLKKDKFLINKIFR